MKASIHWNNGHITKVNPYFAESVSSFEKRILKAYGQCDCRITLNISGESFYIK